MQTVIALDINILLMNSWLNLHYVCTGCTYTMYNMCQIIWFIICNCYSTIKCYQITCGELILRTSTEATQELK